MSPALVENLEDAIKQPSVVAGSLSVSGDGIWLTWVSASDDIHASAPCCSVEGGNIVPDRRVIQGLVFHPRHESGRSVGFPLDVTYSSGPGLGDMDTEFEPAGAGAEGQYIEGICSHIHVNPPLSSTIETICSTA